MLKRIRKNRPILFFLIWSNLIIALKQITRKEFIFILQIRKQILLSR